jgi:hypothetical protein
MSNNDGMSAECQSGNGTTSPAGVGSDKPVNPPVLSVERAVYDELKRTGGEMRMSAVFKKVRIKSTVRLHAQAFEVRLARSLTPDVIKKLLDGARVMRRGGQAERAELLLRLLISAVPTDPDVNFRLGYYLFMPFASSEGVPYLKFAIQHASERKRVISASLLAFRALMHGRKEQAMQLLQVAGVNGHDHLDLLHAPLSKIRYERPRSYSWLNDLLLDDDAIEAVGWINAAVILQAVQDPTGALAGLGRVLRHGEGRYPGGHYGRALRAYEATCDPTGIAQGCVHDRGSGLVELTLWNARN